MRASESAVAGVVFAVGAAGGAVAGAGVAAVLAAAAAEVVGGEGAVLVGAAGGVGFGPRPSSREGPAGGASSAAAGRLGVEVRVGHGEEQVVATEAVAAMCSARAARDLGGEFDPAVFLVFRVVLDEESWCVGLAEAGVDLDDGAGHGQHPGGGVEVADA